MNSIVIDSSFFPQIYLIGKSTAIDSYCSPLTNFNVQEILYKLLKKNNLNFSDIGRIIYSSGPGSYTGLRNVDIFANILKNFDVNVFSFYHFAVPKMFNYLEGVWFCNAFKGEVFLYSWNKDGANHERISENDFLDKMSDTALFTGNFLSLSPTLRDRLISKNFQIIETQKIIENNIVQFSQRQFGHEKIFYFRTIDEEFKKA